MDRMQDTITKNSGPAPQTAPDAPKGVSAPPTPKPPSDASQTVLQAKEGASGKVEDKTVVETKPTASELLKKLTEVPKEGEKTPPTPEQKKEYTMKELRLRAEKADSLEKELSDVRKEIETAKTAGATPEQIKTLTEERDAIKAEREDYKKKLAAVDVMQSEPYIENVTKPMEAIWKDLNKASEEFKFPISELAAALNITDHRQRLSAISKVFDGATEDIDALNKQDLVEMTSEFMKREYYGRTLLADSGKAAEALKAEATRKSAEATESKKQAFTQQADHVFKQMFSEEMLEQMPFLAPKGEDGKPVLDKAVAAEIRAAAKDSGEEPYQHALKSYALELLPRALSHIEELGKENESLKDRIGKLSGAGPKPGGEIRHEEGADPDNKLTLQERLEKLQKANGHA